jgi:hypothetical protein
MDIRDTDEGKEATVTIVVDTGHEQHAAHHHH